VEGAVLDDFMPVAIVLLFAIGFAVVVLGLARFITSRLPASARATPYECGVRPHRDARGRMPVKFYVVAMLFILFDIEATFLYPWAVVFKQLGLFGVIEMFIFIAVLLVGYAYIWRQGVLEWRA
jgi:NADH-quinone oxidoreductase subunit A